MRRGFERARGEFVAFLDADGEIRPGALLALVPHLEERRADVVVGRKVMAGPRPWHRRVMRWGVRWIGRMAFGLPVTDPQTGIKVIARRAVGPFLTTCRERGYLFDLELLAVARRGGARLREVDVEVRTVRANRIPSSAGFHYLLAASALWWRYRRPVMATAALGAPVSAAPRDGDSPARRGSGRVTAHPALVYALLSPPEEPAP
jgi:glycosyltransferase involved in cell wall biosynthesis